MSIPVVAWPSSSFVHCFDFLLACCGSAPDPPEGIKTMAGGAAPGY